MAGLPRRLWAAYLGEQAKQVDRAAKRNDWKKLRELLFDRQLTVFNSLAKRIALLCGRRSGKTRLIAILLLATACRYEGPEMSLYATLTAHHSARNLEKWLDYLINKFELPVRRRLHHGQLYYTHENGHDIWLTGAKDHNEADKLRGDGYRLAIVDESGSLRFASVSASTTGESNKTLLEYICTDCVGPALSDLGGTLIVSGSPGIMPAGFFWATSTGDGEVPQWETHDWTVLDNPHHPYSPLCPRYEPDGLKEEARRLACEIYTDEEIGQRREQGIASEYGPHLEWLKHATATFLREWLKRWVRDAEAICYPYQKARNEFRGPLPQGDWRYVLSIDLGYRDHTTFIVSASRANFPDVYFRKAYGAGEMNLDQIVAEVRRLMRDYKFARIVMDEGGQGLMIAETIKQRYGLPIEKAEKRGKGAAIRALATGLKNGTVFIDPVECSELIYEWQTVTWNEDRTDHDDACVQDCSDGALYGYREHRPRETWDEEEPAPRTREAIDKAQADRKRRLGERATIMHDPTLSPGQRRAKLRRSGLG